MGDPSRINMDGLKQGMDAESLDLLLAASLENFTYITDTYLLSHLIIPDRLCMALMPREGDPWAFICHNEERQTRSDTWITDINTYVEFRETPMRALAELLKDRGLGSARIGIEKKFLAACYVEELAASLPEATLVGADPVFDAARAVKTPAEIEILTKAAISTEKAILASFQAAKPGDTEKKVADDMTARVLNAGATSRWIVFAAGENTAVNHPFPGSKTLVRGEILRVDFGAVFGGYQSDVARTAVIGPPNEEQRSIYKRLLEVQRETISAARPGARACDVYNTYKRGIEKRGLPLISQAIGHGLGIGLHEFPVLQADEKAELKPGMVLNVEPAVVDSKRFVYHKEDLFVVTEDDPKILTTVMDTEDLYVIQ